MAAALQSALPPLSPPDLDFQTCARQYPLHSYMAQISCFSVNRGNNNISKLTNISLLAPSCWFWHRPPAASDSQSTLHGAPGYMACSPVVKQNCQAVDNYSCEIYVISTNPNLVFQNLFLFFFIFENETRQYMNTISDWKTNKKSS